MGLGSADDLFISLRRSPGDLGPGVMPTDMRRKAGVGSCRPGLGDGSGNLARLIGPGIADAVAEIFAGAAVGRDHHGRARHRRFEGRQPGGFEPARQRQDLRRRVGRLEQGIVVIDPREPAGESRAGPFAVGGVGLAARQGVADHHERQAGELHPLDQPKDVLPWLDPADVEHEIARAVNRPECRWVGAGEALLDAVGDGMNLGRVGAKPADELLPLGDRVGQDGVDGAKQVAPPGREPRDERLEPPLGPVRQLAKSVRGQDGHRPRLDPADRREHHR